MSDQAVIYLISAASFVAILALIEGLYLVWVGANLPGRSKTNKRFRELYAGGVGREEALSLLRKEQLSRNQFLHNFYRSVPRFVHMHRLLEQSAIGLSLSRFMLLQILITAVLMTVLVLFTRSAVVLSIFLSIFIGFYGPYALVKYRCDKRRELFQTQLPDALDYMARSLRAGNPFSATLKLVSQEMPEPIAGEFSITFDELNFGLELDQALHGLHERTQSEEIRYFVTAVILQKTTGGNLAEVLNRIAAIIRSRATTKKEIKILSAEMKQSAYVLFMLPFIVALALLVVNPGYLSVLVEHDAGIIVIGLQVLFMVLGVVIVQKMINFRV
jgi:tight adherence protein B